MITVHHLQNSRSQRILWMLEELGVEYAVNRYERDPETQFAPPELLDIHPLGKSPIVEDGEARVAESGAIIEFLGKRYGRGSMVPAEDTEAYREYIYWLHYAEGSLMTPLLLRLVFERIKTTKMPFFAKPIARGIADKVMGSFVTPNLVRHMQFVDDHLAKHTWFAGDTLTGADVQMSFPLEASVARGAVGDNHKNILSYVSRIHARPAYQAALEKGGSYDYA